MDSIQMLDKWTKIKDIIKWAKGQGVRVLRIGDLEVEFSESVLRPKAEPPTQKTALEKKLEAERKARDFDELQYWSS